MVHQLSKTPGTDEKARKATPQPPTSGRPVDPGVLFIDGAWREASDGATAPTITPIDESEITTVAQATESDVESAIAAARTAAPRSMRAPGQASMSTPGHRCCAA
jgi:hypothetical protein